MKVVMIGTPVCIKCKQIAPQLEEYCKEHEIEYVHYDLPNVPKELVDILMSKNIKQAPAFIIYKQNDIVVISGDSIFLELESL